VTKEALRSFFPNAPDQVFEGAWQKLKATAKSDLATFLRDLKRLGYTFLSEAVIIDPKSKKIYRPDILAVKAGDMVNSRVVVVEIKSGKHYDLDKLRRYKKLVEDRFAAPTVAVVYLGGSNTIKVIGHDNKVQILKKGVKSWELKPVRRSKSVSKK